MITTERKNVPERDLNAFAFRTYVRTRSYVQEIVNVAFYVRTWFLRSKNVILYVRTRFERNLNVIERKLNVIERIFSDLTHGRHFW